MIQSMTGFGAAEHLEEEVAYAAEIRTVNSRYLKLTLKLPERFSFAEAPVDKLLRRELARGSVVYTLRVRDEGVATGLVNRRVLQGYVDQLSSVNLPPGVQGALDLATLATLSGVCQAPDADDSARRRQLEIIEELTHRALAALLEMRQQEGKALHDDLQNACRAIREHTEVIGAAAPRVLDEYHERLRSRVELLLREGQLELEQDALQREVAIFAERCDVSEELTRLASHVDQFGGLCAGDEQAGRKLEFLAQEMLREANTVASKSNDAQITREILEVKVLIDRLREQVQNVQ